MSRYKDFIGLGIAGNFALHLDQAGEAQEFKDIVTDDETAPKGMFPFYLPTQVSHAKNILTHYPLSSDTLHLPAENLNIQAEPEVALICSLTYSNGILSSILPTHFCAYNDCSIRVAGANKISDKKNWGENSKGISNTLITIDKFEEGGVMDNYSIASFLRRDGEVHAYGEDVALTGYSYFYEKLIPWMQNQLQTQKDIGPLEALPKYIQECNNPTQAIISIGATRYTPYGEKTFLKSEDVIIVILYDRREIAQDEVLQAVTLKSYQSAFMSVLSQKVI